MPHLVEFLRNHITPVVFFGAFVVAFALVFADGVDDTAGIILALSYGLAASVVTGYVSGRR